MMRKIPGVLTMILLVCWAGAVAGRTEQAEPGEDGVSILTVIGRGEVSVAPDQAFVRLGAITQAPTASDAQERINRIVQEILDRIKALGVPENEISTVELFISPVYGNSETSSSQRNPEPVIQGYRAGNVVRVRVDDLRLIGKVVDAGLGAGANRIEGISFSLQDDCEARRQALRLAAGEAKNKALTIARAMEVQVIGVRTVSESGVNLIRPRMEFGNSLTAAYKATPVQSGQVQVEATLTVSYDIVNSPHPKTSP